MAFMRLWLRLLLMSLAGMAILAVIIGGARWVKREAACEMQPGDVQIISSTCTDLTSEDYAAAWQAGYDAAKSVYIEDMDKYLLDKTIAEGAYK